MGEKARIKRIDKIGSTAEIPYTRTIKDVKSQRWIANRFYRLMGRAAPFLGKARRVPGGKCDARGVTTSTLKTPADKIKTLDEAPKENIRTAKRLENLARGRKMPATTETACDYYYGQVTFTWQRPGESSILMTKS